MFAIVPGLATDAALDPSRLRQLKTRKDKLPGELAGQEESAVEVREGDNALILVDEAGLGRDAGKREDDATRSTGLEELGLRSPGVFVETPSASFDNLGPAPGFRGVGTQNPAKSTAGRLGKQELSDLLVIIVGDTPAAESLLERRLAAGGRALLLWAPETLVVPAETEVLFSPSSDAGNFVWRPPEHDRLFSKKEVGSLRRRFGSSYRSGCKFGPDILDMLPAEKLEFLQHPRGRYFDGVRAVADDGSVLWHVSGVVVKASEGLDFDMRVRDPEKMPFAIGTFVNMIVACSWYFLLLLFMLVTMMKYEPFLSEGQVGWWRAVFSMSAPAADLMLTFGEALTGVPASLQLRLTAMATFAVVTASWGFAVFGRFRLSFFSVCICFGMTLIGLSLPVYAAWAERKYRDAHHHSEALECSSRRRGLICWSSIAWTRWLIMGIMGPGWLMYAISASYILTKSHLPNIAAIALPLATALVNKLVVMRNNRTYQKYISSAREAHREDSVLGDQRRFLNLTIQITFSHKESTLLISLLAGEVLAPSNYWPISLFLSFIFSIVVRLSVLQRLLLWLVPDGPTREGLWKQVRPTSSKHLHDLARYTFGYPRFVAVFAVALARWIMLPPEQDILFNGTCLWVAGSALILEIMEDFIVFMCYPQGWAKGEVWPEETGLDHFDRCFDCNSSNVITHRVGIAFHGVRRCRLSLSMAVMGPATFFTFALMSLLLGTGYIVGMCEKPHSFGSEQVADSILWTSPLRCVG